MARKVADFVSENISDIKRLASIGVFSPDLIEKHRLYVFFNGLPGKSKMEKYEFTAQSMRTNYRKVMRAVEEMNRLM